MNRFEKAVYDCMNPVEELLQRTENPLHRAILENFRRHVHLEGSGQFDKITAPDMTVDNPVYRVSWGDHPADDLDSRCLALRRIKIEAFEQGIHVQFAPGMQGQ